MNNDKKRNLARLQQRQGGFSGNGAPPQVIEMRTEYGHDGTHVRVIWPRDINNLRLTIAECIEMEKALAFTRGKLEEHLKQVPDASAQPLAPGSVQQS